MESWQWFKIQLMWNCDFVPCHCAGFNLENESLSVRGFVKGMLNFSLEEMLNLQLVIIFSSSAQVTIKFMLPPVVWPVVWPGVSSAELSWTVIGQLSLSWPPIGPEPEWGQQQWRVWGLASLRRAEAETHWHFVSEKARVISSAIQRHVRPRDCRADTWMILDTWGKTSNITADEGSSRGARPTQVSAIHKISEARVTNSADAHVLSSCISLLSDDVDPTLWSICYLQPRSLSLEFV